MSTPQILRSGLMFPEAPRWHDDSLYFSDMAAGDVLRIGLDGQMDQVCSVPGSPSGSGWLPDGRLLVVSMHERRVYRLDADGLSLHAELGGVARADLNDMVVDSEGNAYVSGHGYDSATEPRTSTGMILVRPDGAVEMQEGDLFRPNGCVITPDGTTLIVAETRLHRLSAFTIASDGHLHSQRTFADLPSGSWTDGICLDEEGAIWVGDPRASRCVRVLDGGEITDIIDTPVPTVACMLGGPNRDRLFLLQAPVRPFEAARLDPQGQIAFLDVPVRGAGLP